MDEVVGGCKGVLSEGGVPVYEVFSFGFTVRCNWVKVNEEGEERWRSENREGGC